MTNKTPPTDYPLKVVGINKKGFSDTVINIVKQDVDIRSSKTNESSNGQYISITLLIAPLPPKRLESLFKKLTALPSVKLVL